ncbi:MAG: ankyrin repeat domain-containing protein [Tatlockia sp.]|nr:ankyrin repeat domain-containing protein [Tatlockia sp.]
MFPIAINKDFNIICEITLDNYQQIVVLYNSEIKDLYLSINDYLILKEDDAIKEARIRGVHWKIFKPHFLHNIFAEYFNGSLNEGSEVIACCLTLGMMEQPILLVPTPNMMDKESVTLVTSSKNPRIDPMSTLPFSHLIEFPIIDFLIQQLLSIKLLLAAQVNNLDDIVSLFEGSLQPLRLESTLANHLGWSAIDFSVFNGNLEMVNLLIEKFKFDSKALELALKIACKIDNAAMVSLLLCNNASPDYQLLKYLIDQQHWNTALAFVKSNPQPVSINNEIKHQYSYALVKAAEANHLELVKVLIQFNAPLNGSYQEDKFFGWTALHFAIHHCNEEMIAGLLNAKPQLDFFHSNALSVLQLAFEEKYPKTIALLLKHGAKPDYQAFTAALYREEWESVDAFLGANPEHLKASQELINAYSEALNFIEAKNQNELKKILFELGFGALHFAIHSKNNNLLIELLAKNKLNLEEKNEKGQTPLRHACLKPNAQAVSLLLQNGAIPDYQAFNKALQNKSWEVIIAFVKSNSIVNQSKDCHSSYTQACLKAAESNQIEMMNALIEAKTSIDRAFNSQSWSVLHIAVDQGNYDLMECLFNSKISANIIQIKGPTALTLAFEKDDPVAVELLLKNEATIDYLAFSKAVEDKNWRAVFAFIKTNPEKTQQSRRCQNVYDETLKSAILCNQSEVVSLLLEYGATPNFEDFIKAVNNKLWDALLAFVNAYHPLLKSQECINAYAEAALKAAKANQLNLIKALIAKNASMHLAYNYKGWCSLHFAVNEGNLEMMSCILDSQINPGIHYENNATPLQIAFENNQAEAIKLLLENGAKPDYKAFTQAIHKKHEEATIAFVKNNNCSKAGISYSLNESLYFAAINNLVSLQAVLQDFGCAKFHSTIELHEHFNLFEYLKKGSNPNERDILGKTLLENAFQIGNSQAIAILLQNKATPNYQAFDRAVNDKKWETALAFIANNPKQKVPNADYKKSYGQTLIKASADNQTEIIIALLNANAPVKVVCTDSGFEGWYPLHFAIHFKNDLTLNLLLEDFKVNPNKKHRSGTTPLNFAFIKNNIDAICLLLEKGATPDYLAFSNAIATMKWEAILIFLRFNPEHLNNPDCIEAYVDGFAKTYACPFPSEPVLKILLPALFINLANDIKSSLSKQSQTSEKATILEQYISILAKKSFCFQSDAQIKKMLISIVTLALQRESGTYFGFFSKPTTSSNALCNHLTKAPYQYLLNIIMGSLKEKPAVEHLIAFVREKQIHEINSDDYEYFDSMNKSTNYTQAKEILKRLELDAHRVNQDDLNLVNVINLTNQNFKTNLLFNNREACNDSRMSL